LLILNLLDEGKPVLTLSQNILLLVFGSAFFKDLINPNKVKLDNFNRQLHLYLSFTGIIANQTLDESFHEDIFEPV
jgi:hypothetical protein